MIFVQRNANDLGLPQNYQSNCVLNPNAFDDALKTLSLPFVFDETDAEETDKQIASDADVAPAIATLFKPDYPTFLGDLDLHFDAEKALVSATDRERRWNVFELDLKAGVRASELSARLTELWKAIRSDELANFFEIVVAFDELVQGGSLIPDSEIDGEQTYLLSTNGRIIAQQLETTLAHSVKRKAYNCALRLLGERRTARENFVDIVKTESGFEVNCRVSGGDITLLSFTLYAPDYEQAEIIKENFLGYPRTVYKTMLGLMTKNTESVGEALEEVYGTIVNP